MKYVGKKKAENKGIRRGEIQEAGDRGYGNKGG
jgi:hypothetical protein